MLRLDKENFDDEINKDVPIIVDFWAEWCAPCKILGPIFEELSQEYEGKLRFAKLDTEESQEVAGKFGIMGIPTMIMLNKGQEIGRIVGALPKEQLKQKIDELLGKI